MNTFDLVSKYVNENNITEIIVCSKVWNDLVDYISSYCPWLDSEYYGFVLFDELYDLNVTCIHED